MIISAKGLYKRYQDFLAVDNLDLNITAGSVYAFLGPNGAGKTTTIRLLTGILLPDAGELRVFGQTFARHRREILQRLGYIPDRPFLYGKLTALEMLEFQASLHRLDRPAAARRANQLLEQFGLLANRNQLIEQFSHGMRQKLVIASALLHQPELIIVDEPMVGLDPRAARQVKEIMRDFARGGRSVFMSTHSLDIAATLCDRIGIIHHGRLIADQSLPELRHRIDNEDADLEAVFLALTADHEAP